MKDDDIKPVKKGVHNPKHIPLLLDVILIFLPFAIPHPNIFFATIAIIKILISFHLVGNEHK